MIWSRILQEVWVADFALVLANRDVRRTARFQWIARACPDDVAVFTTIDGAIVVCGGSWNRAEGPNGCGLVVLDVEEAVQLGDLEQVADPLAEVHQL